MEHCIKRLVRASIRLFAGICDYPKPKMNSILEKAVGKDMAAYSVPGAALQCVQAYAGRRTLIALKACTCGQALWAGGRGVRRADAALRRVRAGRAVRRARHAHLRRPALRRACSRWCVRRPRSLSSLRGCARGRAARTSIGRVRLQAPGVLFLVSHPEGFPVLQGVGMH